MYRRELVYVWGTTLIIVALRARVAWVLALPGVEYEAAVIAFLGFGYAFAWLLWRHAINRRRAQPKLLDRFMRHRRRFRWLQWGIALYVFTLLYPWPAALRFAPQLPAFSAYAKQYLADPNTSTGPVQIGFEQVAYVWGRGQGFVWFALDRDRRYGIAQYSIDPDDANSGMWRPRAWIWPGWYVESWNPETW